MNLTDNLRKILRLNNRTSHTLSVFLFFSILFTIFFAPVIFSKRLLAPGDGITYYLPAFYSHRTLWTDLILSGFPVAADPQIQTWYPISLLFSLIPNSWNAFVISAYVLASCFTYGYVYSLTNSRLAGLVSGIVYSMSGFMMAHLGHTTMIHAAAWMPLLIWATHRLSERLSSWWLVMGTGAVTCSVLAGHPQIALYAIGLSTAYGFLLGWTTPVGRWKYYGIYLSVIVLGIFLAAIQIVPTAELSGLGLRAEMTFEDFVSYSLPPQQISQLLFPYLFGGGGPFQPFFQPPYFGEWNLTGLTGYIGLLPPLLAIIGFIAYRDKPLARFWLAVAFLTLLLALGDGTPLARLLYYLPAYNKFRAQGRHFIEMALAVSVLAGLGVGAIQKQVASKRLVRKTIGVSTLIVIVNLVGIFVFSDWLQKKAIGRSPRYAIAVGLTKPLSFFPWTNSAVGVPLVIFLLSIIVLLYWSGSKPSRLSFLLVLMLVLIDLGSFGWFYEWKSSRVPSQDNLTPTAAIQKYRKILNESKQRMLPTRGGTENFDEIPPNISRLWGVPSASGYGPLILSRYSELFPMGGSGNVWGGWASVADRSLDIMSVSYIIIPPEKLSDQQTNQSHPITETSIAVADNRRWRYVEYVQEPPTLIVGYQEAYVPVGYYGSRIYENLRAMPRVWLVPEVVTAKKDEVLQSIKSSKLPDGRPYDPSQVALVETPLNFKVEKPDTAATAKILNLSDTRLEIKTNSSTAAFLVLSDVYYPGWSAKIDGKPTKIFQTNYVLRGVQVPAGKHTIKFEFKPVSFHLGVGISVASLFLLGYLAWKLQQNPKVPLTNEQ